MRVGEEEEEGGDSLTEISEYNNTVKFHLGIMYCHWANPTVSTCVSVGVWVKGLLSPYTLIINLIISIINN